MTKQEGFFSFLLFHKNHENRGASLLFAGAVAKSAQFALHVWLPDAMEVLLFRLLYMLPLW